MTIRKALIEWMEANSLGTFGTDIFAGAAPLKAPDKCFWIMTTGGAPVSKNVTGEREKAYVASIYYRNTDAEDVDEKLQELEELINSKLCDPIPHYENLGLEATAFPSDQDLDNEERSVGLLQVTISTYSNN